MKTSTIVRIIIFLVWCMLLILATSCVKDNDPKEGVERFAGLGSGAYSGNVDSGTWSGSKQSHRVGNF